MCQLFTTAVFSCLDFCRILCLYVMLWLYLCFNETATTEIYTYGHALSLHDALPILQARLDLAREINSSTPADKVVGAVARLFDLDAVPGVDDEFKIGRAHV